MEKKYELIKNEIKDLKIIKGDTLVYRVRALRSFGDVKKGDVGGFIQSESNLSHDGDCWVYDESCVYENAYVSGNSTVRNRAHISGNAYIYDGQISDHVCIFDDVSIYDGAIISGYIGIFDQVSVSAARISGDLNIYGNIKISGNTELSGNGEISGNAEISDGRISKNLCVDGTVCVSKNK